nr:methyltransferase [Amycolatopsis jiangsuensis]
MPAVPAFPRGDALPVRGLLRLPGVYRPQADSCLLASVIRATTVPARASALDLCTGTGVLALVLARTGAESVLAVDLSRLALCSARMNGAVRRLPVRTRRGGLPTAVTNGPYDLVAANPPYVPCPPVTDRTLMSCDAGPDGRAVLDPLCEQAPALLAPEGQLLLVHSTMSDVDRSRELLEAGGLRTSIAAKAVVPFGPVVSGRLEFLVEHGFVAPDARDEELVVLRAQR